MRRAVGIAAVVVLLAGAFALGLALTQSRQAQSHPVDASPARLPSPISQVRAELRGEYYRAVPHDVLARPTIAGMLNALGDPYTDYLTAAQYAQLKNDTQGRYGGVGLTVSPAKEGLIVTSAPEGPARSAGIRPGDVIISIDGVSARALSFERSMALVKGAQGTVVELMVQRPKAGQIRFRIVRDEVPAPDLQARLVSVRRTPFAYVRLLAFPAGMATRLEQATARLVERGARGLVLDLRGNPGGLLAQAVGTVSIFVPSGIVCTTDGFHQEKRVFGVSGGARFPSLRVVVLVDRGSASAAEVVAAALADDGRAAVVGQRTYGKATVQTIRLLSNGGALKLTTATYRTPAGRDITRTGVRPSVHTLDDPRTRRDEALVTAEKVLLEQLR
ncbi:MAG: S41 family peptidase [Actinobacteria bacterium]|nr:MAG: S41 family peptidase [Actinomycetota bacterium]